MKTSFLDTACCYLKIPVSISALVYAAGFHRLEEPSGGAASVRIVTSSDENTIDVLSALVGEGYSLKQARKHVRSQVEYRHALPTQLLHVTLAGRLRNFKGSFGRGHVSEVPSRPGLVCFAPPHWERSAVLGRGEVTAVELELEEHFVADACERNIRRGSGKGFFNASDAKATAIVRALANAAQCSRAIIADTLALALARHVGFAMLGCERRGDDGWLHPAALGRVLDLIEETPGRAIRLGEMATLAGLGQSAFIRAFRGATGKTPAAFVLDRRLCHADAAVRADLASLDRIASDHGFSSKAHFISAYRRRFGSTPGRQRATP